MQHASEIYASKLKTESKSWGQKLNPVLRLYIVIPGVVLQKKQPYIVQFAPDIMKRKH